MCVCIILIVSIISLIVLIVGILMVVASVVMWIVTGYRLLPGPKEGEGGLIIYTATNSCVLYMCFQLSAVN